MATAIKTTVKIEFTEATIIRMVARQDIPEYGLKAGQCFYAAKSDSLGDNQYHIVVWNYEQMRWECPCKCGEAHNHNVACKHVKAVNLDCHKAHSLFSYKPTTPCKGEVVATDKAATFATLFKKYDYRQQEVAPLNDLYASQVAAIMAGQKVQVAPGAFCLAR